MLELPESHEVVRKEPAPVSAIVDKAWGRSGQYSREVVDLAVFAP